MLPPGTGAADHAAEHTAELAADGEARARAGSVPRSRAGPAGAGGGRRRPQWTRLPIGGDRMNKVNKVIKVTKRPRGLQVRRHGGLDGDAVRRQCNELFFFTPHCDALLYELVVQETYFLP